MSSAHSGALVLAAEEELSDAADPKPTIDELLEILENAFQDVLWKELRQQPQKHLIKLNTSSPGLGAGYEQEARL